ncbi:hypothetical protein Bca52824_096918 [Brassica carinata]|uniref:DUF632 domain-containing protein n=1 Tax=Brassica carinata TaxID=52824 RepID=A0A8X7NVS0_BRACI|nr:hypothetical protein Bca52824_096918 [Brassica carinata]
MPPSILEKMGCSNSKKHRRRRRRRRTSFSYVKKGRDSSNEPLIPDVPSPPHTCPTSVPSVTSELVSVNTPRLSSCCGFIPSHNSSSYPDDDSVDSPLSRNSNPLDMPELSPPPPRPRRPETSSWDYFDTCDEFDSFRLTDNASVVGLEKQSKQSNAEDFKTEQRKQSSEDDGEREDPSEFITHRAKDFVSSMKDIEHKFFRASESGKEVSRMLEATKIRVRFADDTTTEPLHQRVTKVIVWKRTSSSRSSTSRNPLIEDHHDDESGSDFTQEFCMISGSHSSSLDRLYAWERKLYDEVKMIRKEYDRKCEQLRNQFTKDHSAKAMDKTRAAAKDLHSRIRVAIQSVDLISKRIERIRDEELQPQLLELLQGLIRMWKAMLECHHSQYITISLAYHCRNTSKTGPESSQEADLVRASRGNRVMTSYVEALNGWLHNCVLLPQERSTRNRRPWSPRRVLAPPIFVLCRDWSAGMKSLPSDELSRSIKEFSTDMEMLGEEGGFGVGF